MPQVTEKYRARQRLSITIAARRCFARTGFHATTMDEIVTETGMSPATVYRYFPSKADLIEAVCIEKTGEIATRVAQLATESEPPMPGAVLATSVRALTHTTDPGVNDDAQVAYLALNIWAELQVNADLRGKASSAYEQARAAVLRIAERWHSGRLLRLGISPEVAASVVWKYALGFIADEVISNDTALRTAAEALDTLLLDVTKDQPSHA